MYATVFAGRDLPRITDCWDPALFVCSRGNEPISAFLPGQLRDVAWPGGFPAWVSVRQPRCATREPDVH
jgi:hypothetical protein